MAAKKSYTRDLMFLGDNPASAVRRGQEIDRMGAAHRAFMAENARLRAADDARRVAIENSRSPSMTVGGPSRVDPNLINDALARATLGGLGLASFAMPLRAGLAIGAGSESAALGGTEDAALPGALAALGVAGRAALPVLGAAGAAYAADADAAITPGRRLMHLINSEGFKDLRPAREFYWPHRGTEPVGSTAFDDPRVASRLLVDVPGANLVPVHRRSTKAGLFNQIDENGNLRVDDVDGVRTGFAGGGSAIRKGLEKFGRRAARGEFDETAEAPMGALSVVKPKGGNWLSGSVEDALVGTKFYPSGANLVDNPDPRKVAIDRWIEGPLTKYVKTRMASPEDEVRKLAEEGVLHFDPTDLVDNEVARQAGNNRWSGHSIQGKIPVDLTATNQLARLWEQISDAAIEPKRVGDPLRAFMRGTSDEGWLSKASDDSAVYRMAEGVPSEFFGQNLFGFPHLIDELSNALRPDSDLPRHLQLTPEAMQNLSMEKAVRRVADINAWRAAQKAEASRALAEKASLVREYADDTIPNPKGLRWVELKAPKVPDDELGLTDRAALEQQLKYEGDIMGHCVGGYCDDVLEGRSRIFSLRDAKGEPHVTVEVGSPESWLSGDKINAVVPSAHAEFIAQRDAGGEQDMHKWLRTTYPEIFEQFQQPKIVQIKGKQNRAPNEEYLPFVQDFVRNSPLGGQWSDVGDLQNAGMLANKLHPSGYITRAELEAAAKNPPEGYVPEDFIWPERYAGGGPVTQSSPADTARATIPASWETLFPQGAM